MVSDALISIGSSFAQNKIEQNVSLFHGISLAVQELVLGANEAFQCDFAVGGKAQTPTIVLSFAISERMKRNPTGIEISSLMLK